MTAKPRPTYGPMSAQRLKIILAAHSLASIRITVTLQGAYAAAIPDAFNPTVKARREAAIAQMGGSITLKEVSDVNEASLGPVAQVKGETIEHALAELRRALEASS